MSDDNFLSRWSRRKIDARAGRDVADPQPPPSPAVPAPTGSPAPAAGAEARPADAQARADEVPALDALTPASDFAAFMRPGIDPAVQRQAMRTLFSDPSLYPVDGLDVYMDDYTLADPLPVGWLEKLEQYTNLHGQPQPQQVASAPEQAPAPPDVLASTQPQTQAEPAAQVPADVPPADDASRSDPSSAGPAEGV